MSSRLLVVVGLLAPLGCRGATDPRGAEAPDEGLRIQVYAGAGVEDPERAGRMLQQALEERGMSATLAPQVTRIEARSLVGVRPGDGEELGPLKAFVDAHARSGSTVHLVVLDAIVDPRSTLARSLKLEGLGLSVAGASTPAAEQLMAAIGPCAPVLLVDDHALEPTLLVHELGHALGLPHHPDPANLMHEQRGAQLTDAQRAQFQRGPHDAR